MKRVVLFLILALTVWSGMAQEKQKNRIGIRYAVDWVKDNGGLEEGTYADDSFSNKNLELFYKWYLKKNWFVEPAVSIYLFEYDTDQRIGVDTDTDLVKVHLHNLFIKENGLGASVVGGYSFPLAKRLTLDIFAGLNLKYALKCRHEDSEKDLLEDVYNRAYLSWQAGVGLNYWLVNLSFKGGTYLSKRYKLLESETLPAFCSLSLGVSF